MIKPQSHAPRLAGSLASRFPLLLLLLIGCASSSHPTTRPTSWTDQARNDPMNYNPGMDDWPSVSGGGLSHFDKQEFNRDVDHVINP
ncbi:MAG TPA: hypothetical protein VFE58_15925 [Tepidisphaeraceae bacterium]|nr:hypothetical protein [Tepidisphaeraceae bacterium]